MVSFSGSAFTAARHLIMDSDSTNFIPLVVPGGEVIQRLQQFDADARTIATSGCSVFCDINYADTLKRLGAPGIVRKLDSKDVVFGEIEKMLRAAGR